MRFDISKKGLLTIFKPYQAALMEHIWELNKSTMTGITSGQAYDFLQNHPDKKSRTAVYLFLNKMVDEGVLTCEQGSSKGGYRRIYYPKMDRAQFSKHVIKTITDKLHEVFRS